MKIVIDIDDDLYTRLFDNGVDNYDDAEDMATAIRKGTPLPKGHGRLIDANKLEECKEIMNTISGESKYAIRMDDIRSMSTIIEADTESEDKT